MALDLTRPEECEKAELTLRYACLTQYMVQRLFAGQASDAAQAEALVLTLAHLRRILSFRNLCVYSAHLGVAGGARSLPLEEHVAAMPLATTHQLYMKPGDAEASVELMHAATAALHASGEAGASLARLLDEPYAFNQYYMASRRSLRVPDAAFEPDAGQHLESPATLQAWLLWAADAFPRDPRFPLYLGTHIYGLAVAGVSHPCVELCDQGERVVPSFADAHRFYLRAAELAEASQLPAAEGVAPQAAAHMTGRYWWEAANSLAASNGADCRGVPLQAVRDLAARAEAAEARLRGLFGDGMVSQTSVAVRMVLDATRTRVGSQRLTRAEHRRFTREVLEGTPQGIRQVIAKYSTASQPPKRLAGLRDVGPGWIPGAAVPRVGEIKTSRVG
jgi:hypothetical protein